MGDMEVKNFDVHVVPSALAIIRVISVCSIYVVLISKWLVYSETMNNLLIWVECLHEFLV